MRCPAGNFEEVTIEAAKNSFAKFLRMSLFDRFTTRLIRLLLRTAPQNPPFTRSWHIVVLCRNHRLLRGLLMPGTSLRKNAPPARFSLAHLRPSPCAPLGLRLRAMPSAQDDTASERASKLRLPCHPERALRASRSPSETRANAEGFAPRISRGDTGGAFAVTPARFRAMRALLWSGSTRKTPHRGVLLAQNDTLGRGLLAGGSAVTTALSVGYAATSPSGGG